MTPRPEMAKWSAKELDDAMRYGVCLICRSPRQARHVEIKKDGKTVAEFSLVCPNGHLQR